MPDSEGCYSVEEFIIEVQVLEGALVGLVQELRRNTVGTQGSADRLAVLSQEAHRLSEIAQDGHIKFP